MKTIQDIEAFGGVVIAYWITLTLLCIAAKFFWIWLGRRPEETFVQAAGWCEEALIYWICCFFCITAIIALLSFQIIVFLMSGYWYSSGVAYLFPTLISDVLSEVDFSNWKGLGKIVFFVIYKIPLYVPFIILTVLFFRLAIIEENKPRPIWPSGNE